ncbi:hypothetical protein [Hyphomicrobium sp.]|uniref:hypothetical protein n=1 Tax=Hyphomicrobium sp. TaxID=82 RepID=UPI0025C4A78A|nr:hypothetical protein [Hyphomicrobium sp.]
MKSLKICVATATLACLSAPGAMAQDAGSATPQPPPAANESQPGQKLPDVEVIQQQQQKTTAKPKKAARKAKQQPVQQAGPPPAPGTEPAVAEDGAAPTGPVFAVRMRKRPAL